MEYTVYMAQIHVVYDTYTKGYTLFYYLFTLILMDKSWGFLAEMRKSLYLCRD